jgi:hypothetical protein
MELQNSRIFHSYFLSIFLFLHLIFLIPLLCLQALIGVFNLIYFTEFFIDLSSFFIYRIAVWFFFRISVALLNSSFMSCIVSLILFRCLVYPLWSHLSFYTCPLLFWWSFLYSCFCVLWALFIIIILSVCYHGVLTFEHVMLLWFSYFLCCCTDIYASEAKFICCKF